MEGDSVAAIVADRIAVGTTGVSVGAGIILVTVGVTCASDEIGVVGKTRACWQAGKRKARISIIHTLLKKYCNRLFLINIILLF